MNKPLAAMIGVASTFCIVAVALLGHSLFFPKHATPTTMTRVAPTPVAIDPALPQADASDRDIPWGPPLSPADQARLAQAASELREPAPVQKVDVAVKTPGEDAVERDHHHLYALAISVDPSCASDDHVTLTTACYRKALTEETRQGEIAKGMSSQDATGDVVADHGRIYTRNFIADSEVGRK